MSTRVCHWCGEHVPKEESCPHCLAAWTSRKPARELTPGEREAEARTLEWAEVPFDLIHARLEELIGRPVWTHEFGLNWEGLMKEARWEGRAATMSEIVDLIPPEKRLVVVVPEEEQP